MRAAATHRPRLDTAALSHRSSEAGFTLMEMMVATTITLVVTGLTFQAFSTAQRANQIAATVVDTNANLRAGMNFMVRELAQTGAGVPIGGISMPAGVNSLPVNRPSWQSGVTFDAGSVLNALTPGDSGGPAVGGQATVLVTILYEDTSIQLNAPGVTVAMNDATGTNVTVTGVQFTNMPNEVDGGDLIMFENGLGRAIQSVTQVNGQVLTFAAGDAFNLNQPLAAGGSIVSLRNAGTNTWPTMTIKRIRMVTFYLEEPPGAVGPRLMRRENFDQARPIALVMDNLQMSYDIVDGATNPANVADPDTPSQIRKINLWLYGRSASEDVQNHRGFRTYVATQVSLRSLSFVNTL